MKRYGVDSAAVQLFARAGHCAGRRAEPAISIGNFEAEDI